MSRLVKKGAKLTLDEARRQYVDMVTGRSYFDELPEDLQEKILNHYRFEYVLYNFPSYRQQWDEEEAEIRKALRGFFHNQRIEEIVKSGASTRAAEAARQRALAQREELLQEEAEAARPTDSMSVDPDSMVIGYNFAKKRSRVRKNKRSVKKNKRSVRKNKRSVRKSKRSVRKSKRSVRKVKK